MTAQQAVMLNKAQEEMPSVPDIAKVDDIELQEITEKMLKNLGGFNFSDEKLPVTDR